MTSPAPETVMMVRRRLDSEIVRRGLAESRVVARQLIERRRVLVGGAVANKAARQVAASEAIQVKAGPRRFVSRGGLKLEAALNHFGLDCEGQRVVDAGSSTGGFTDCVLSRGAAEVVAIDVGRNQLHEKLRRNPRVKLFEQTNIRHVQPADICGVADLVVADLSFISLRVVAKALMNLVAEVGDLLLLVKPQFEAGKAEADRGRGVISDPAIWRRTLGEVAQALVNQNAAIMGAMVSPITGGDGNVEFFVHARREPTSLDSLPADHQELLEEADRQELLEEADHQELLEAAVQQALELR